jgi:hypothetical protein|uniref:Uncharacterized protein n=1 Tax=Podoviridae sp. ctz6O13 TaxID=2827757 RepID=A0A8S5TKA9_9CAUD|nr:MAG TPA: hypothetical protein [Podoviridae sp. ctz6O13]
MAGDLMMFGKSYNKVGNNEAHLCLYTAGDVSVKTANRFVPLFKNGKLAVDDATELFAVGSEEEITKNGVYVVSSTNSSGKETKSVYVCVDGIKMLLSTGTGSYLSYDTVQDLKPEEFIQASENMGLYFKTLEEAKSKEIQQGLVYVLDTGSLYKVIKGEFSEIKTDRHDGGEHGENQDTITVGNIFVNGKDSLISGESQLSFQISGTEYLMFRGNQVFLSRDMVIGRNAVLQSEGAERGRSGFMMYKKNDETFLEVDNLILHKSTTKYEPQLFTAYVGTSVKNLITDASASATPGMLSLGLKYKNAFKAGDYVLLHVGNDNRLSLQGFVTMETIGGQQKNVLKVEASLESSPTQTVSVKAHVFYNSDTGMKDTTVTISIPPTVLDPVTHGQVPNKIGVSDTIPDGISVSAFQDVEILAGDANIYYGNIAGGTFPSPIVGTVSSVSPFTVNFPSLPNSVEGVLRGLKYATLYKIGDSLSPVRILYHEGNVLSFRECTVSGGKLMMETKTQVGDLSSVNKPKPVGSTVPDIPFDGLGIYSDNLNAVQPHFYGCVFEKVGGTEYPVYGAGLNAPNSGFDGSQYDAVVPNIAWIKKLIKKAIDDSKTP